MAAHYLEKFKEYFMIKGYAGKSITSISKNIGYFLNWLQAENVELEEVSYTDVVAYINYKRKAGNKPRSLQLITNALNHFFNFLVAEHHFAENPAAHVKIQGVKRQTLIQTLTPEELDTIYKSYRTELIPVAGRSCPPQEKNKLARKRNKVLLGLLVYQGIRAEEISKIELSDLHLREGKITIQGGLRSNSRTLKLEPHQIFDLYDYINDTRKHILAATQKESTNVFISTGTSLNYQNCLQKLIKTITTTHPKLKDLQHIRTSVIANWLKVHNLRKTQYMAGHRYVSSTESYQAHNIDELSENIIKYHPLA